MPKKLLMLWNCTLAMAEPDTALEYVVHMYYAHPSISKKIVIFPTSKAGPRIANYQNVAQITQ